MARLNYHHLRYFWAVAHQGNLTRTAERLAISQSALSTQIRKLEEQLGTDLFAREGKQLRLTEAGRRALDYANTIFETGEELWAALRGGAAQNQQVLRIGSLATLSRNFQIQFLRPLLTRDDVEIIIRSGSLGELLQQLEAHRLDLVLANLPPPRDAATPWISHLIDEQPVSLVGTPRRIGPSATLADLLAGSPLIVPTLESSVRVGFDALVQRLDLCPTIFAEVDDMAMMRLLTREDVGLAIVPPIVVRDELDSGRLVEANQFPQLHESFYAVELSRRFPNPLVSELLAGSPLSGCS